MMLIATWYCLTDDSHCASCNNCKQSEDSLAFYTLLDPIDMGKLAVACHSAVALHVGVQCGTMVLCKSNAARNVIIMTGMVDVGVHAG